MLSSRLRERALLLFLLDACLLWIAFIATLWVRVLGPNILQVAANPIGFGTHLWALLVAIPLHAMLSNSAGLYGRMGASSRGRLLALTARTFVYLGSVLALAIFLLQAKSFSRMVFFLFVGSGLVLVACSRLLVRSMLRSPQYRPAEIRNVLIVGVNPDAMEVRRKLVSSPEYGLRVVGCLTGPDEVIDGTPRIAEPGLDARSLDAASILGSIGDLRRIVIEEVIDEVVFALPFAKLMECEKQIAWCEELGTTVHLKMDFIRTLLSKTYPSDLEGTPMLTLASTPRDPISLAAKRGLDIVVPSLLLLGLAPVLAACALLIVATSRGPVLFRQKRVGLSGRIFTLYKFRSMCKDAETRKENLAAFNEMSGPVFKMKNDPRVTPVGRWLRKFSLDELPQLWNVLVGDLSLVGPRPPTPDEVQHYERWQRRRLSVKPGVTCLWQVSGRSRIDFEEWMRLDLKYIDSWSLKLDMKILLRTIPAVLSTRGSH